MFTRRLLSPLTRANRTANCHRGRFLLLALVAVVLHNWRLWRQDKALLARKGQPAPLPPLERWPDLPQVSVLVAAWNEAAHIERHIASFMSLRYPHKELVLCAGGDDGTYDLACRYTGPALKVLRQEPAEGKQRALARAFGLTGGEVIFLTDADCLLADEPFERTLWPLVAGGDRAVSGSSQPLPEQMQNPFVFTQAATQLYEAMHRPSYAAGMMGCNCAVRRDLLVETAALDVPARTGTDYVLAKTLNAAGVRIRQVPESRIATDYPTTAAALLRQQRRWLRNVIFQGRRFGAVDEARRAATTSLVGVTMLSLPLFGLLAAPWLLAVWVALAAQALTARLRYLAFAGALLQRPLQAVDAALQSPLLLLDFVAWTQPLADYLRQRDQWV